MIKDNDLAVRMVSYCPPNPEVNGLQLDLTPELTRLQTWLTDARSGKLRGTYHITVLMEASKS